MAHSIEVRKLAVEYYKAGHTPAEVKEVYKVSRASLFRYKKEIESGAGPKPKQTRKRKITSENLKQVVKERPDAYLHEYAVTLGCTPQAVFSALKRHKITYKKRRLPTPKKTNPRGWNF